MAPCLCTTPLLLFIRDDKESIDEKGAFVKPEKKESAAGMNQGLRGERQKKRMDLRWLKRTKKSGMLMEVSIC